MLPVGPAVPRPVSSGTQPRPAYWHTHEKDRVAARSSKEIGAFQRRTKL